jgi:hypothetical protein
MEWKVLLFNSTDGRFSLSRSQSDTEVAALQAHVPIVELLLKLHDINPNFQGDRLKAAPLLLAAGEGHR